MKKLHMHRATACKIAASTIKKTTLEMRARTVQRVTNETPPFLINTIYVLSFSQMKDISINYFHNKRFPLSSFKLYEIQKIRLALGVVLFTLIKYKLPNDMNL